MKTSGSLAVTATAPRSQRRLLIGLVVLLFFVWAGRGTSGISLSLPSSTAVHVVVAVLVIAGAIFIVTPRISQRSNPAGNGDPRA